MASDVTSADKTPVGRQILLRTALRVLAVLTVSISGAVAQSINELGVFGDNIADPGNIPGLLAAGNAAGLGPLDTNFPPSPPNFGNRFSNGRVAAEILAGQAGIEARSTANFAVGNAFSAQLPVGLAGGALIGNGSAIPGPIGRGLFALNNTDVGSQVSQYLAQNPNLNADDLMLVYASANDAALALNTIAILGLQAADAQAVIFQGAVTNAINTAAAAQALIGAGARQVILANLPDIGRTPAAAAGGLAGVAAASAFSQVTNATLAAEAARLNLETNAIVSVFDGFTLLNDIVSNPAKYGLTNITDPCVLSLACLTDPATADGYLFWDPFYPTAAVHAITAAAIADTVNAPKTIVGQAEVSRYSAERFVQSLLQGLDSSDAKPGQISTTGWQVHAAYQRLDWQRDGETLAFGYDSQINRYSLGAHYGQESVRAGLTISQDDGDVDLRGLPAGFDYESTRLGAYVAYQPGQWNFALAAGWGDDDFDNIQRRTGVAGQSALGETQGDNWSVLSQVSRLWMLGPVSMTPTLRLGRSETKIDSYREFGAVALEQQIDARQSTSTYAEIGTGLQTPWLGGDDGFLKFRPSISLFYRAELDDKEQFVSTRLVSVQEVTRTMQYESPDSDYWRLGVDLAMQRSKDLTIRLHGSFDDGADGMDGYTAGVWFDYRW